jgi:hypothetical protein
VSNATERSPRPSVSPEALARARKELEARRQERGGSPAGSVDAPPPWIWDNLDPESLETAWHGLAQWLATEAAAHAVTEKVPAGWWRYRALVRYLAAVCHWQAFANRAGSHPRELVDWEESFYRMVDLVWPRYVGLSESKDELRHRDRAHRADEELSHYVASAVADRAKSRTPAI